MKSIVNTHLNLFKPKDIIKRDGIKIDKGVILTENYLISIEELLKKYINFFTAYPDLFLDTIKPKDSEFTLFFYQRIALRAMMRYKDVYIVACRAFSKSFISILALILQCIFMPSTKRFICAPFKNQSAQIAKEKINEIYDRWPLLMKEINANPGKDRPGNFGEFLPISFELLEYPKVYFTTA